ncbi:MAG: phage tail assembly chaperone [Gammaproteobacteria bacterium]|nr:phage tail assembly chaperone [Gammaproteobacteria bacterium]
MYKIHNSEGYIQHLSDMAIIPNNPSNRDWREYQAWLVSDKNNKPLPMDIIDPWIAKRQERNLILQSTDWTVLPDAPLTLTEKTAWKAYRQKLRDLPRDYAKVEDIKMPSVTALVKA